MNIMRMVVATAALALSFAATTTSASAWGCVAEDSEGANGWSTKYSTEGIASQRAFDECLARSNTQDCQVTECNEDW